MFRKITFIVASIFAICTIATAQPPRPGAPAPKDNDKPEEKIELTVTPGMVGVARHDND